MKEPVHFDVARLSNRADIPDPPIVGTAYFISNERKILLALTGGGLEEYGGGDGGGIGGLPGGGSIGQILAKRTGVDGDVIWIKIPEEVVDSLDGDEPDKAPSTRAVNEGMKAAIEVVDSLEGGEKKRAPSVHAVNEGFAKVQTVLSAEEPPGDWLLWLQDLGEVDSPR